MRGTALLPAAALLALTGCGPDDRPLNNQQIADAIENLATPPEEPDRRPPPPALIEIRAEDLQREVRPGAGCDFSEGGRLLFVAVSGDAFAKVNGLPVHFGASGPTGPTGGFWVTDRFSLSIGRLADSGVTVEETTTWPARAVLTDRRQDENNVLRLEGAWRCGA
jgi:hypothetical protein